MEIASTSTGNNLEDIGVELRNVYYKLRSVFPNINPAQIKNLIKNPASVGVQYNGSSEQLTTDLCNYLSDNGSQFVDLEFLNRSQNDWNLDVAINAKSQLGQLIGIFPDVDPDFLEVCANTYKQARSMALFIEDMLENKIKYPTREEYVARKKFEEEHRKYFKEFSVKEFLAEIPNPFTFFQSEQRKCSENAVVSDLLCERFNNLEISIVKETYKNSEFNATVAAMKLEKLEGTPSNFSQESLKKLTAKDSLKEFSFICNRKNIEQYFEKMKKEEEESKVRNELLHCEVCFNDFIASQCSTCESGHIFCNNCIVSGTETYLADAVYKIKCFADCNSLFNQKTLQSVLPRNVYQILIRKQQEEELISANIQNLESCPFCGFKSEVDEGEKIFSCMNEECKRQSCRRCKKMNHLPYECLDISEKKEARLYVEEKMTKAVVRTCFKCKKEFLKLDGCNRMVCVCKAVMCYICDKEVPPDDYRHFNGQGAERHDLCPLYSDDKLQEAEAVLEVARVAKQKILKENPNLDPEFIDKLVPIQLPSKTAGPHDQISNAGQLSVHAMKVAKTIPP